MSIWQSLDTPESGARSRPELAVELRLETGRWIKLPMIVDSGSDMSIVPLEWVTEYELAMNLIEPRVRSFRTSSGAVGYGYRGNVQLRIAGEQFSWPCLFSLPPDTTEPQAEVLLEKILIAPVANAARQPDRAGNRVTSVESWIRNAFPEFQLRPALLGRRGFLEKFEVLICSDYLWVRKRSRWRDFVRRNRRAWIRFLHKED